MLNRTQFATLIAITIIAGWIGGAVSGWVFGRGNVFAQKIITPEKIIRAERFEVVDENNRVLAVLGRRVPDPRSPQSIGTRLVFYNDQGRGQIFMGQESGSGYTLKLYDNLGRPRADLSVDTTPSLIFYGPDRKSRVMIGNFLEEGNITLYDNNMATALSLRPSRKNDAIFIGNVMPGVLPEKAKIIWSAPMNTGPDSTTDLVSSFIFP